jgi:hypothetical protein
MNTPLVAIHMDMKYLMPKKSYLLDWVRRLPEWGVNAVLLEYEDKFPFEKYPFLRHADAWTAAELKEFLGAARGAGVRVIPLVQTLSHLEFALAHPQLAHLREAADIETQICPCKPEAVQFVHDLIDEIMAWHGDEPLFHAGADEAWFLGTCPACAARTGGGKDKAALWLTHTRDICNYVIAKGKRPIVWDDSFWHAPKLSSQLPKEVILGAWHYHLTRPEQCDKVLNPCLDAYRRNGQDAVTVPCCNWGVVLPGKHALANTAMLAAVARKKETMGIINSAWTCFHTVWQGYEAYVAATGAAMKGVDVMADSWREEYFAKEFGARVEGLLPAFDTLGAMWEIKIEGFGRPVSPIIYGYMDMVVHYKGGQLERQKRGIYPLDWKEIDFNGLYRRKLDLIRALPEAEKTAAFAKLDEFLRSYAGAAKVMDNLRREAKTRRDVALLFSATAELKLQAARALSLLLRGDQDAADVRRAYAACHKPIETALRGMYEPFSAERLLAMWWAPTDAALRATPK